MKIRYDSDETQEWIEAYQQVIENWGIERGQHLLEHLQEILQVYKFTKHGPLFPVLNRNSIIPSVCPEDLFSPDRQAYRLSLKWNAVAIVMRAQRKFPELGGHISTCMSIADLYDIGFEYFFKNNEFADCVYFQGHSTPIIYARSFVEGRLNESALDHFRQEVSGLGLSSYPHPYLMPEYWQFPTVSMGLGLLQAIYQARILKYLDSRNMLNLGDRRVWAFVGDGEMREPESVSALMMAAIDKLSHLTVVLVANLQGLDGLCHGNGSVVREYSSLFQGAGWRVIKIVWNTAWLELFASEKTGVFEEWMMSWVDGEHQNLYCQGREYLINKLRQDHPELIEWLISKQELLDKLAPGGHDAALIYQAYQESCSYKDGPTVIIAQTIKGYALPMASQNIAHQQKKMSDDDLVCFAKYCQVPREYVDNLSYYKPKNIPENMTGKGLPRRVSENYFLDLPSDENWQDVYSAKGSLSSTTSFVRVLGFLLRSKISQHIVPILADEARTFGMEGLFKQLGVYVAETLKYESHDLRSLTGYRESCSGQLLQEGVNEAGALAAWLACATSYSVNKLPLVPFYIFYSMFGFQRVMDLIWASADSRARGFLLGATSGKTTLAGEGLQHADGHSILLASVVPNLLCYDPAWHFEVAVIIKNGLERMMRDDLIVYIALVNEAKEQSQMPDNVALGIIKGMYKFAHSSGMFLKIALLAAGPLFHEANKVYIFLSELGFDISIYSVTSFTELRREAMDSDKSNRTSYITELLSGFDTIVAVSDYVSLVPDMLRPWVAGDYSVLGTDGFGLSDTRENLRKHFGVSAYHILSKILSRSLFLNRITKDQHNDFLRLWREKHV